MEITWFKLFGKSNKTIQAFDSFRCRYGEPGRFYHNHKHIESCLSSYLHIEASIIDNFSFQIALLFHDVIYDPVRSDNELQSAQYAVKFLESIDISTETISKVERLIMLTKHPSQPVSSDEKYLIDIDLAILGSSREEYKLYTEQIRKEYSFVPMEAYKTGRKNLLSSFLQEDFIYSTEYFQVKLEEQAKVNLRKELQGL
ncbi:MAG: hypothetical protein NE334_19525 [Lentisphaeraceae bacterium]|nr:hypothetical protein [Lentisphaeraceae bacterium]